MRKWIHQFIQPAFLLIALLFVAILLASQWQELRQHPWRVDGGWLALGAALLTAAFFLEATVWWLGLRVLSGTMRYASAMRIWFLCAVARYVPGNIWQPLSMTYLNHQQGVRPEATITSIAFYQAINLLAVIPIAALYLGLSGNVGLLSAAVGPWVIWLSLLSLLPLFVFLIWPNRLLVLINALLQKLGRATLPAQIRRVHFLVLMAIAIFDWLVWGAGFACVVFALNLYSMAEMLAYLPHLVASFPISYALGYLSFITPSGLGVREGVLYVLLAPLLGGTVTAAVALAVRMVQVLLEVAIAVLLSLLAGRKQRPQPEDGWRSEVEWFVE